MSDYQCIVKNVRCAVRLGVYDFEKIAPQNVLVSVVLHIPFSAMRRIRSLNDTVDYEPIYRFIESWSARDHVELIENLLHELVDHCFADARVASVEASIRKTTIFDHADEVGVGLVTTRTDWSALTGQRNEL
jgi:dihydroneopterin aldolase